MKLTLIVIKFLFVGALFIVSNHDLHLGDHEELSQFGSMYYSWLGSVFHNSLELTGYVMKSEWLPEIIDMNESAREEFLENQTVG